MCYKEFFVFLKEEIEKERGVILAEMKASMDSVEDLSFKRVNEIAFEKSCLRYDVAGTEKNVKKFTRKDLISYYEKHYIPNNTLITMVSSLEHEEALEKIKENFGHWQAKEAIAVEIIDEQNKTIRKTTHKKNIELSTIMYLFTFYDLEKDLELPLRILNHRLGESSNSLLFREVREIRGLAYDIYSHLDMTNHIKSLYIYTAVAEEDVNKTIEAINEILEGVKEKKIEIGDRDLDIMKKVHKTAVISTLDDSSELCSYILNQSIEDEDIYEFLHDMERINNITSDEIYEAANKVLKNPTIHILKS